MVVRCTRCKKPTLKGRKYCKPCAVQTAKEFGFDEFIPQEPDQEEVDLIAEYERRQLVHTWIGITAILLMMAVAIWVLSGGA